MRQLRAMMKKELFEQLKTHRLSCHVAFVHPCGRAQSGLC